MESIIISLGGSVMVPDDIDIGFISSFRDMILRHIKGSDKRFYIICGGGKLCRRYQDAANEIYPECSKEDLDWIGIKATRLNAELIRSVFGADAHKDIIVDPSSDIVADKNIIIGAGFIPGGSTDLRSVDIAEKYDVRKIINVSNVDYVYTADPNKHKDAKPIKDITWKDFLDLIGDEWRPGLNAPFDPVASKKSEELGLKVIFLNNDIENLNNAIEGREFIGTIISYSRGN